jgi:exosome complex RNA-binding protein Rrp4
MNDDIRIVIGQRGWVWVGRYREQGDEVTLESALNIRRWGTTRGLGQLVGGPTQNTVLEPAGTVRMHRLSIVATYQANADEWRARLGSST